MLKIKTVVFLFIFLLSFFSVSANEELVWPDQIECLQSDEFNPGLQGWCLMVNHLKGNCLACHAVTIEPWPDELPRSGNIGPPLSQIQKRYPNIESLKAIIGDATQFNLQSSMPPYLKNGILNAQEVDLIAKFLWSI